MNFLYSPNAQKNNTNWKLWINSHGDEDYVYKEQVEISDKPFEELNKDHKLNQWPNSVSGRWYDFL